MKYLLTGFLLSFAVCIWSYLIALCFGRGWKHGRGDLPTYIVANNPTMTLHNSKIMTDTPAHQEGSK